MAENKCDIEFLDKIAKHVGSDTGKEIISKIKNRAREIGAKEGIKPIDAIDRSTKEISDEYKVESQEKTRQALINIKKAAELKDFTFEFKDPSEGLVATVGGMSGAPVKGAQVSVDALQRQWRGRLEKQFERELTDNGVFEAYHDRVNDRDVWNEAFGKDSKNADAKKIHQVLKNVYEVGRKFSNKMGAAIGDLREYIGSQNHNVEKILKLSDDSRENRRIRKAIRKTVGKGNAFSLKVREIAFEKWSNFILQKLDQERTFKGADQQKFLKDIFDNIIFGRYNPLKKDKFDGELKFTGPANIAKKMSRKRVFHFKDGDSAFEYDQRYGHGSLPKMTSSAIDNLQQNLGLMQKYGVNSKAMFERMIPIVRREALERGVDSKKISKNIRRARNTFAEVDGSLRVPLDNMTAKIFLGARAMESITKLGFLPLRALPDIANKADELRANGMNFLQSSADALLSSVKGFTTGISKEDKILRDMLGTYFESRPTQLAHQITSAEWMPGLMTKAVQLSYKLSGMVRFDEVNRSTLGISLSRNLSMRSMDKFTSLPEELKTRFFEHGLGSEEWDLMRRPENLSRPVGNKKYITPDAARDYSKESIAQYLNKPIDKLIAKDIEDVKDNMEVLLRTYYMNATENVAMLPGARERAMMHHGTDPNSVQGAFMRSITQFKGFGLSYTRRKLGRIFGKALMDGFSKENIGAREIGQLTNLMVEGTLYGYLGWSLTSLAKGQTPPDPTKAAVMGQSMLRGGAFGIYNDFLTSQLYKYKGLSALLGPTYDTAQDVTTTMVSVYKDLRDMRDPSGAIFHLAKNNIPLVNLWYTKAAMDYLFLYGMQEHMSPGSLRRMQDRMKEETGQQLIGTPYGT